VKNTFYAVCALALWGMLAVVPVKAEEPGAAAEKAAVEQTFRDYVATFIAFVETGDSKKLPTFFAEPVLFPSIGQVAATPADVEKWAESIRPALQKKGYARFDPQQWSVKLLGKNAALLSYSADRKTKDGTFIEKSANTVLFKKTDAGWKIIAFVFHPAEDTIKFD